MGTHYPHVNFLLEIRRVLYTTVAIELMNRTLRNVTRNRRIFSTDEAVIQVVFLAIASQAVDDAQSKIDGQL